MSDITYCWRSGGLVEGSDPLARMRPLVHGALAQSGKLLLYAVDQGVEHGPVRSFAKEPQGMSPLWHAELADALGASGHAAPLGALSLVAGGPPSLLPLILKLNNSESLSADGDPESTVTASVADALRLGCTAVGLTLYAGSRHEPDMVKDARAIIAEARAHGLPTIVWAYPRGSGIAKGMEQAVDVVAYAAHLACQLGAHIVKAKRPNGQVGDAKANQALAAGQLPHSTLKERIAIVKASCLGGTRLLVCSGGEVVSAEALIDETRALSAGGADGLAIGRNIFQRGKPEREAMARDLIDALTRRKKK